MDEFSGGVAFIGASLLFVAAYFGFQTALNNCLLPVIERTIRKRRKLPETELNIEPVKPAMQEIDTLKYNKFKQSAQQKIQQEQAQILENCITYAGQELSLYMEEKQLQQLCEHIRFFQYATETECSRIQLPVTVDSRIKPIDLMHFGWNIGNQFHKTGIETATFIKQVFAEPFEKVEISTIKRKLRVEGTCKIKLAEEIEPNS